MTHPSLPVIDRQDDPVCGHCGCWRSVHEDCDGTLYCPPHGATFEPNPTPSVVTGDEVERAARAIFADRFCGDPPVRGFTSNVAEEWASLSDHVKELWRKYARAALAASDRDVLVAENERSRELLSEAEGWLSINSAVNHEDLCAQIRAALNSRNAA